jgi:hypothetical protein
MTDRRPANFIGMTLAEADPDVFAEARENLQSGSLSPAAGYASDAQRAMILSNLMSAKIIGVCECGQANCRTYKFRRPPGTDGDGHMTLYFHVRGELLVWVTDDMDVIDVERLYDENDDGGERTVYGLHEDGGVGYIVNI